MSLVLALGVTACTTASETELQSLGAALGNLPLAAPKLPQNQLPPNQLPPGSTPQLQLCTSKPDLNVASISATNSGYAGWLYVCARVKNTGGATWTSNASQVAVRSTSNASGSGTVNGSGFASLASGATVNRCGWMKLPGLLRMGHDEPQWGECKATLTVTSSLSFDPDILSDGNTANDDCLATNNKRTSSFNYMQSCPW